MRIAAVGIPSDPVMVHFCAEALRLGADVVPIALGAVADRGEWYIESPPRGQSWVSDGRTTYGLETFDGFYIRLINVLDHTEHIKRPSSVSRWRGLLLALTAYLREVRVPVINRPGFAWHNASKPLHAAWMQSHGLEVPASITSSDCKALAAFCANGRTIVKPLCGARANTREVAASEFEDYSPSSGPVFLQRYIEGVDIRVHVVGANAIASGFRSNAVDYRRDRARQGVDVAVEATLERRLCHLTEAQGLAFAGWDFVMDADDRMWCLEANPMPGYSYYDTLSDGSITAALLEHFSDTRGRRYGLARSADAPGVSFSAERYTPDATWRNGLSSQPQTFIGGWFSKVEDILDGGNLQRCACARGSRACGPSARQLALLKECQTILDGPLDWPGVWRGRARREVLGHGTRQDSLRYVSCLSELIRNQRSTDLNLVYEINHCITGNGDVRTWRLATPDVDFPDPAQTEHLVVDALERAQAEENQYIAAAGLHLDMMAIHAFADGNGRTSRLVSSALLLSRGVKSSLLVAREDDFEVNRSAYVGLLCAYYRQELCRAACLDRLISASFAAAGGVAALEQVGCNTLGEIPSAREAAQRVGMAEVLFTLQRQGRQRAEELAATENCSN